MDSEQTMKRYFYSYNINDGRHRIIGFDKWISDLKCIRETINEANKLNVDDVFDFVNKKHDLNNINIDNSTIKQLIENQYTDCIIKWDSKSFDVEDGMIVIDDQIQFDFVQDLKSLKSKIDIEYVKLVERDGQYFASIKVLMDREYIWKVTNNMSSKQRRLRKARKVLTSKPKSCTMSTY